MHGFKFDLFMALLMGHSSIAKPGSGTFWVFLRIFLNEFSSGFQVALLSLRNSCESVECSVLQLIEGVSRHAVHVCLLYNVLLSIRPSL